MKKIALIIVALVFLVGISKVKKKTPNTYEKTFGGVAFDEGKSVIETSDGDYLLLGETNSFEMNDRDMYLVKTNNKLNIRWSEYYGGEGAEFGHSMIETKDGGYLLLGYTKSFGKGEHDMYLVKTDNKGKKVWHTTYGGKGYDLGKSVIETTDGGYLLLGGTYSFGAKKGDIYLLKTDTKGRALWSKRYGGENAEFAHSVIESSDGGYLILGYTKSYGLGGSDMFLVKTDDEGEEKWSTTFGGPKNDIGKSVIETKDGGYLLLGYTSSFGSGSDDMYLVKTDKKGNELWDMTYGGRWKDLGNCVIETTDGGYLMIGTTESFGMGGNDVYLVKTYENGKKKWSRTFGGKDWDAGHSVIEIKDGGYLLFGETSSYGAGKKDMYLIKTDKKGNVYGSAVKSL
ncbi:hypothetical protein ACFL2A_04525 [Thermodesulfobacteriota bacterium]